MYGHGDRFEGLFSGGMFCGRGGIRGATVVFMKVSIRIRVGKGFQK